MMRFQEDFPMQLFDEKHAALEFLSVEKRVLLTIKRSEQEHLDDALQLPQCAMLAAV
jgi:hypothetical protein